MMDTLSETTGSFVGSYRVKTYEEKESTFDGCDAGRVSSNVTLLNPISPRPTSHLRNRPWSQLRVRPRSQLLQPLLTACFVAP